MRSNSHRCCSCLILCFQNFVCSRAYYILSIVVVDLPGVGAYHFAHSSVWDFHVHFIYFKDFKFGKILWQYMFVVSCIFIHLLDLLSTEWMFQALQILSNSLQLNYTVAPVRVTWLRLHGYLGVYQTSTHLTARDGLHWCLQHAMDMRKLLNSCWTRGKFHIVVNNIITW